MQFLDRIVWLGFQNRTAVRRFTALYDTPNLGMKQSSNSDIVLPRKRKKFIIEDMSVPEKPKKPSSSFFRYLNEKRSTVKQENPNITPNELIKIVARDWNALDDNSKKPYLDAYYKDKEKYSIQLLSFETSITDDQRAFLCRQKFLKEGRNKRNQLNRHMHELGKPRKPSSSYLIFLESKRQLKDKEEPVQEWVRKYAAQWNTMSEAEKEPYKKQYDLLFDKYKADLSKWENEIMKLEPSNKAQKDVQTEVTRKIKRVDDVSHVNAKEELLLYQTEDEVKKNKNNSAHNTSVAKKSRSRKKQLPENTTKHRITGQKDDSTIDIEKSKPPKAVSSAYKKGNEIDCTFASEKEKLQSAQETSTVYKIKNRTKEENFRNIEKDNARASFKQEPIKNKVNKMLQNKSIYSFIDGIKNLFKK